MIFIYLFNFSLKNLFKFCMRKRKRQILSETLQSLPNIFEIMLFCKTLMLFDEYNQGFTFLVVF